jgi:hypothetical protein
MVLTYRRPGVYLEESLLVSPVDIAGTITVACFVGVAGKGPINEPQLCTSWSDYVTVFGDFASIAAPIPDPNVTYRLQPPPAPQVLSGTPTTGLKQNAIFGDGLYVGDPFAASEYVLLGDSSKAYYSVPALSTNRAAAAPGQAFASDPNITASNPQNAAKLASESFVAAPTTAWTTGQNIWVGPYPFYWAGAAANQVQTVTPTGTISGGTFRLTVFGTQTGDIAFNAAVATIKAAIDAVIPSNTITVGGTVATAAFTLTFTGYGNVPLVTVQPTLTGTNPLLTPAITTPGGGWSAGTAGGGTPAANNGVWVAGAAPGEMSAVSASALSYLPFAVYSFFQNGGRFAWIIRSVDQAHPGTAASINVNSLLGTGSELQSFALTARSVGTWGNTIKYLLVTQDTIGPPNDLEDIFTLQILVTNADGKDEVVETWRSLSVRGNNPQARRINAALNDPATGSRYVFVTNINDQRPQPSQTTTATALMGGINPGFPRADGLRASADFTGKIEGPVTLNIVGYLDDASKVDDVDVANHYIGNTVSPSSFADRQDLLVINDSAKPRTPGDTSSVYMNNVMIGALSADSGDSYSVAYGPWIIIPHPQRIGTTIAIPPGGAVMGMTARIDSTMGVFRAPAGVVAGLSNAVGVQTKFTDAELGDLNAQNINIIRSVVGAGICVMGARTRKSYGTDRYVSARRTLIYIKEAMRRSTQFAVFENNDQRLWESLRMSAERILRPLWEAGGLRGSSANQAYYINCDEKLNTPPVIQSGEVRMEVGVALEYPAEFVIIRVTQFERGTFSTEVQPIA